ncbi:hypothetical protein M427DRAFT_62997 [Gonapodya prolifera JEL478]|uniref:Uncharacterized protein n=1 Tax=Gonapodya prolifera (strain JEL478) TaxID=1344416 RepID=A0A138ZZW9_GONPJ|nr:hypothetical protein M427DRAFT_62997 [Gonapodya prolifera JEL478]|eukprot:KXS10057.1 hypothetical protein M427DRAFT_62997 [Gonapodya prolifera JEL478]
MTPLELETSTGKLPATGVKAWMWLVCALVSIALGLGLGLGIRLTRVVNPGISADWNH